MKVEKVVGGERSKVRVEKKSKGGRISGGMCSAPSVIRLRQPGRTGPDQAARGPERRERGTRGRERGRWDGEGGEIQREENKNRDGRGERKRTDGGKATEKEETERGGTAGGEEAGQRGVTEREEEMNQ